MIRLAVVWVLDLIALVFVVMGLRRLGEGSGVAFAVASIVVSLSAVAVLWMVLAT